MDNKILNTLTEQYPFITVCSYAGFEYVGLIQNRDTTVTTIYDFGAIKDPQLKKLFLELGATWWWESNHSVPINIFLKTEWAPFKEYLKTFSNKDLDIIHGPVTCLNELTQRKTKRKSITLVKKMD